jgi:hypothetical protein
LSIPILNSSSSSSAGGRRLASSLPRFPLALLLLLLLLPLSVLFLPVLLPFLYGRQLPLLVGCCCLAALVALDCNYSSICLGIRLPVSLICNLSSSSDSNSSFPAALLAATAACATLATLWPDLLGRCWRPLLLLLLLLLGDHCVEVQGRLLTLHAADS